METTTRTGGRPPTVGGMSMEKHITLLGALHLGIAAVLLSVGLVVFVVIVGGGFASRDPDAMAVTFLVGATIGTFLFLLALPGLLAGWGLLQRRSWSRILALVVGAINLVNVPLGTALGVYTIWVLMQDDAIDLLEGRSGAGSRDAGRADPGGSGAGSGAASGT